MNDELFQKLKELERYCKEDFLISLTNKGIYNRALKDFEKIKDIINIKFDDDNIKVSFEDVEVIFKNDEIKNSVCSCPSKTICKHVIISILYIKDYLSKIDYNSKEEEAFNKNNFNYIINISVDELKKLSSKK
ncbi:SWIM zinc finger family protein, partial [Brachyspira pilosicoli]|nr:SWIM zinc finger family protein [Brachyspira pilosicoli]